MTNRVVLIEHNQHLLDTRVHAWLKRNDFVIDVRRPCIGDAIAPIDADVHATVLFGGPHNVYETDKHPFLLEEYRWIETCLDHQVPILGICQGAQQIAHHLGAWSGPTEPVRYEFGHYEIHPSDQAVAEGFLQQSLRVTQAHFHTFDLPSGAVHLARSDGFENQAFRFGTNTYGFQFHAEQRESEFRNWQNAKWAMFDKPGAQSRAEQNDYLAQCNDAQDTWFNGFLDDFLGPKPMGTKKGDAG